MAARTGQQFLAGLRGDREVWVEGERVTDVVSHPAFSGAAHALAEVFDLQHEHADVCLVPDPETSEPINVSHLIPRSREDLRKRHDCLTKIAEYSVGLMGRTPDYMNVTFAGFAGRAEEWATNGNEAGAERLMEARSKPSGVTARVHSVLRQTDQPRVPMEAVAQRLGVSARSLRRRLREEGSSYADLADAAAADVARRLLGEHDASIDDIAQRLGFSEPSAFYRAFKRWTGQTPRQFRAARVSA